MRLSIQFKVFLTIIITCAIILGCIYFFILAELVSTSPNFRNVLSAALLMALVLASLMGSVAAAIVTRPVKQIKAVAESMSHGDFSHKALVRSNDELGDLSKVVNTMGEQINTKSDEALANRLRVDAILHSMIEGVMVIDDKGTIILMNETLKKLLRVEGSLAGKMPLEVVRNIEVQEIAQKVLSSTVDSAFGEIIIHLPSERIFQVNATAIRQDQRKNGAVIVFHDITELRRLEKVRKDFVANVSHELRTPITNIKGYTETLLDGAMDDKENARDFLEVINNDAQRLAQLVEDLLDLSMIESGQFQLRFASMDLAVIIEQVSAGFKKQLAAKSLTLAIDVPADLQPVKVDRKAISQVFINLIDNAIKYNKPGGSVTVKVKDTANFIVVDVIDTGIGIPPDDCLRIFERFYRVDKARSRELGGTGLGLSITKHIIIAHHGEISVESELGKGSTFRITLPKA